ncbi:CMGC/SRPK protein kinase [Teratosphaeria destructans]|uniref:CMGC/SRPK protein kinase n=1 Tax=Teratosphaeria destructans TaxID=418781 RepID=A0A9W7SSL3_9PEZI|nr:CMGC/SRPK protein kinase [Teratosphaeria destructans]
MDHSPPPPPPIPERRWEDFVTAWPPGEDEDRLLRYIRSIFMWDPMDRANSSELLEDDWESMDAMSRLRDGAVSLMMSFVEKMDEDQVQAMMAILFEEDGEYLDMHEIMITALMRYTKETNTSGPSKESVEATIRMMEPFTSSTMCEVGRQIRTASMDEDGDTIAVFFNEIVLDA